jgi:hypothetical protein
MDKHTSKIYYTKNYSQFTLLKNNRQVKTNINLKKSLLDKGVLIPILVDNEMNILDGQHRFTIAKENSLRLPYQVINSKSIDIITDINTSSIHWTLIDYIHLYFVQKRTEYVKLYNLINEYKFVPIKNLITTAQNQFLEKKYLIECVKEGTFKFYNYENLRKCLESYATFLDKTEINSAVNVFNAYYRLFNVKKFDQESFIKKAQLKDVKRKIIGIRDYNRILELFLTTYNYKRKKDKNIYFIKDMKHNIIIEEDIHFRS